MKRIIASLKGKLAEARVENKVKRVEKALECATLNAENEKYSAQENLDTLMANFNNDSDINSFIQGVSDALADIEIADEKINQLKKVSDYFNEEVKEETK